jgi:hypothetical protein
MSRHEVRSNEALWAPARTERCALLTLFTPSLSLAVGYLVVVMGRKVACH